MLQGFRQVGTDLFAQGLISSHAGNLSVRLGDRMVITRRGAMLAHLESRDLVEIGVQGADQDVGQASSETVVHRAIYQRTPALAVVHAHPPTTVALSLLMDQILPVDSEASYLLHNAPVIASEHPSGSAEVAALAAESLKEHRIVVVRGHGVFSTGRRLIEAFQWVSVLEQSCKVLHLLRAMGTDSQKGPAQPDQRGAR